MFSISVLSYLSLGLSTSWMRNETNKKYLRNTSISDRFVETVNFLKYQYAFISYWQIAFNRLVVKATCLFGIKCYKMYDLVSRVTSTNYLFMFKMYIQVSEYTGWHRRLFHNFTRDVAKYPDSSLVEEQRQKSFW